MRLMPSHTMNETLSIELMKASGSGSRSPARPSSTP